MAIAGDRKPRELQMPTFVDRDNVLPVGGDGYVNLPLHLESDGMTFHVKGGLLSAIPDGLVGAGKPLGHGKPAFSFRQIMGPAEQIGPHTFRIQLDRQRARTIMRAKIKRLPALPPDAWLMVAPFCDCSSYCRSKDTCSRPSR